MIFADSLFVNVGAHRRGVKLVFPSFGGGSPSVLALGSALWGE